MGNDDQRAYWSGDVGVRWAHMADAIDTTFAEVTDAVLARADLDPSHDVLDVGCGAGALSRAAASQAGQVTGIDISAPMLAVARDRAAPNTRFLEADAETEDLGQERHDRIISRFGVMFFDDTTAAFANLRRATRPGGRLVFAAWGMPEANPWFAIPRRVAEARLGAVESDPDAPGPFRFREPDMIAGWLDAAGWRDVRTEVLEVSLVPPGTLAEVAEFSTRLGGASRVIAHHEADETSRLAVARDIEPEFAAMTGMGGTRVPARINLVTATA